MPERSHNVAAELLVDLGRRERPGALRDLLAVAIRDPSLRVGFWISPSAGYLDAAGRRLELDELDERHVVTRITSHGEPLAVFVGDAERAPDRELLDAVLGAAQAALDNERLRAELQAQLDEVRASRERIVTATDAERKRIERDLHDGAQQRLVSTTMALRLLRIQLGDGLAADADETLGRLEDNLALAIKELRELARGIHPTLLTEDGLEVAVREVADRCSVPVDVTGSLSRRAAAPVEAAAYFVCCEALTNAVRHAEAGAIAIDLGERGELLTVVVRDDGKGGADPNGSGLRGLADRVAALGGELAVRSSRGKGTRLEAVLPFEGAGFA